MDEEHREAPRVELPGTLPGEVSVLAPIAVCDLSPGGALVESSFPLLPNSLHDLRLELGGQSIVVKARVVHCRIADLGHELVVYKAGVEFVNLPDHAASTIAAFLAR